MMSKRCSDFVESRLEHAIRCRKPQLTTTRRGEPALSIDELSNLSIDHITASATRAT